MAGPIKTARERKGIRSNDALAVFLLKIHPDIFEGDLKRSLSKQIGELDRGNATWWLSREQKMQHLIKALDLNIEDFQVQKKNGRHIFSPAMFPHFPALSLVREETWNIAEAKQLVNDAPVESSRYHSKPTLDFWLTPTAIGARPHQTQWLCVPDNVEFDLLTRKLAAVSRHHVISEKTIKDVLDNHLEHVHHQDALIVTLRGGESGEDLALLIEHRQRAPLLVISPATPPPLPDGRDEQVSTMGRPNKKLEYESWVWTLLPNWRELLLEWTQQRFEQTHTDSFFSSGAARQLLEKFDPSLQWFTGVEDVLVLAQAVSDFRERGLKQAIASNANASELLTLLFDRSEANLDLIERLVQLRWTSWHLPWAGDLNNDEWLALAKEVHQFDLLSTQIITRNSIGYDFKRPIVIRLLLRDYLMTQMRQGKVDAWLPACFDEQRRQLLDAAFDALSIPELEEVALSLDGQLQEPEYLGAGEALFMAAGRRLIRGEAIKNILPTVLGTVVPRLRQEKDLLIPYSLTLRTPALLVEWISICWAWSLYTERNNSTLSSWQFPGWSDNLHAKVPQWLSTFGASHSHYSWDRLPLQMHGFLGVVRRWLELLGKEPEYQGMPPVFTSGMLEQAAVSGWPVQSYWWAAVMGKPHAEQALLDVITVGKKHTRHHLALAWWPSLVAYRHQEAKEKQHFAQALTANLFTRQSDDHHYSPLLAWVMNQLESHAKEALDALTEDDLAFLMRYPNQLSLSFRRELLKAVPRAQKLDLQMFEVPGFLFAYGTDAGPDMEILLDHELLGRQAAHHFWHAAPRKATLLLGYQQLAWAAARNLLITSPATALGVALETLSKKPQLLSKDERLAWIKNLLPDSRQYAPALLRDLAAAQQPSTTG